MDIIKIFEYVSGRSDREWSEGDGANNEWNNNSEEVRQEQASNPLKGLPKLWLAVAGAFFLFSIVLPWLAGFLTDFYWFSEYGFESVFWRRFTAQWQLFAVALVPAFLVLLFNWNKAFTKASELNAGFANNTALLITKKSILFAALFFAFTNALGVMGEWSTFLKFMNPTSFGETDPLFGKDISFYVFSLPFYTFLKAWLQQLIISSLAGSLFIYFMMRGIIVAGTNVSIDKSIRIHLAGLASLVLVCWGAGFWLERFSLLYSPTGVVFGGGYTDVKVILPALSVLAVTSFLSAVLLLVNIFRPMWRVSGLAIGVLFIVGAVCRGVVPGLVQQYRVKPNECEMEKPYLGYHLDYTRRAFALNNVQTVNITPEDEVTHEGIDANSETIRNIRLWDYKPLLRTYKQLQAIRTYYNFSDVFIDRYELDGENRQVMLSVRELDFTNLQNPTWVNTHLEFTHGYGVVMSPVNEIAQGGLPSFFMKDLPTRQTVGIKLDHPEIYFGTMRYGYALVNTEVKEFDYPMGDSNVRSYYKGSGGVKIGSFWKRLLFTLRFRDTEILFTGALKPESRIMFNRNVRMALKKIAPFIIFDDDTYPVINDGHIIWVQDAFTWTSDYPYSKPFYTNDPDMYHFNGVNYLRNSVKATVDAYDGRMKFYIVDDKDPMIKTWAKIFPGLFVTAEKMPDDLWSHVRYPEDYFAVQADVFRTYHMNDTNTYYNREDVWEIAPKGREKVVPNYVTMKLWGEDKAEFAIILPYMPLGRDNMIGWMAGRCDPENYGELLVYKFPKQKLIYGPVQIEALINQNPEISAQLSLWSQRGSDVIKGDLLVIPVGKSILYVQPLYLKAETGELPELKRIITSTGGRVAWGETFTESLSSLMAGQIKKSELPVKADSSKKAKTTAASDISLVRKAQSLYESAIKAQKEGDWARYGEEIKRLGEILAEMEE